MSSFLIVAVLLACAVLLCLLPPLLRRDPGQPRRSGQGQANLMVLRDQARELDADLALGVIADQAHAAARDELAARAIEDVTPAAPPLADRRQVRTALALAAGVPLLAAGLYLLIGNPAGLGVAPAGIAGRAPQHASPDAIGTMVEALAQRLEREPDDIEGWRMLARSYSALDRHAEAARVYARLEKLLPDEPGVLADLADALASAQGASLKGEPERLIARALERDPKHVKALSLSASAAFERGDFALAERQWQAVLAQVPPDSAFAASTSASIAAARASAGTPAGPAAPAGVLSGTVRLAPALAAAAAPTDTVFIYARAVDGSGPPLAALRKQVKDLPFQFSLDDSMGMGGTARLSRQERVMLGARISRSGSATPAAGDLEGAAGPVSPGARDVMIEIGQRRQ